MQTFAKELVGLQPDLLLAISTVAVKATQHETRTVQIVFTQVTDPVAQGLVESLERPGGNITGITIFEPEIGGKWLQVLKEIAPMTARAAVIFNPNGAVLSIVHALDRGCCCSLGREGIRGPGSEPRRDRNRHRDARARAQWWRDHHVGSLSRRAS